MHGWNGDGHMGWGGGWGWGWMPIWWILAAALIAVVVWALIKSTRGPTNRRGASP